ncbi:MAG: GNAT family N-acetyltransferase [Planctomycetota bacterium]|nr:MAG: GNAT family N-acetyltransferase [Planctomycetota bacterium]
MNIKITETDDELSRCFQVMKQLRPHLTKEEYIASVKRQQKECDYKTAYCEDEGNVVAVAGFRMSECLCDGKFIYINDLVSDEANRSKGYGEKLFEWTFNYAKENGCLELSLDSGVQRFDAHRFYLKKKMKISSHHFSIPLI